MAYRIHSVLQLECMPRGTLEFERFFELACDRGWNRSFIIIPGVTWLCQVQQIAAEVRVDQLGAMECRNALIAPWNTISGSGLLGCCFLYVLYDDHDDIEPCAQDQSKAIRHAGRHRIIAQLHAQRWQTSGRFQETFRRHPAPAPTPVHCLGQSCCPHSRSHQQTADRHGPGHVHLPAPHIHKLRRARLHACS